MNIEKSTDYAMFMFRKYVCVCVCLHHPEYSQFRSDNHMCVVFCVTVSKRKAPRQLKRPKEKLNYKFKVIYYVPNDEED